MNARDYLNEAKATIQDRGMDYGHPSDNMARTAALWSSYLEMPVTDYQVAMCMALVKIARSMETGKTDTYVDLVAYTSIAAQLHTSENDLYIYTKDDERKDFMKFAKLRGFEVVEGDN
jgi:hypothetical protein